MAILTGTAEVDINVRVQPKAKRNRIEVVDDQNLKVYVTAAPESGKANDAVIALLSKTLKVPKSRMSIVRGQKSRDKLVRIEGMDDTGQITERINASIH